MPKILISNNDWVYDVEPLYTYKRVPFWYEAVKMWSPIEVPDETIKEIIKAKVNKNQSMVHDILSKILWNV